MTTQPQAFPLDAIRTDGWFERIGEGIGSFQALCEIVGERFVAFSLITGARITALSVDRRMPENTIVDFVVGAGIDDLDGGGAQRLTLGDFRRRLVAALLPEDEHRAPAPERETDLEALQLYIGIRNLLLAPLYGYSLCALLLEPDADPRVVLSYDGEEETCTLEAFQIKLRTHVRDELERVSAGSRSLLDLSRITEAEAAATKGDHAQVRQLLGAWPAPLAIFLRTPDGQMLTAEARSLIAKALGLLGTAFVYLGDVAQGEEIFRLGVQYAQEGVAAGDVFTRLGASLLSDDRAGEAIAALRRAINLGAPGRIVWPLLARAFLQRKRFVAAVACVREALAAGVSEAELASEQRTLEDALGPALTAFRVALVQPPTQDSGGKA